MPAVRLGIAEKAHAEVGIGINEAAEIAREGLDAGAHGNEVVGRREVLQLTFVIELLQGKKAAIALGPPPHVGKGHGIFFGAEKIAVGDDLGPEAPVEGFKGGRAAVIVDGHAEVLYQELLVAVAEKFYRGGAAGADARRGWYPEAVEQGIGGGGEDQETVLAAKGGVALPGVLAVRIAPQATVGQRRAGQPPTIGALEIVAGRRFERQRKIDRRGLERFARQRGDGALVAAGFSGERRPRRQESQQQEPRQQAGIGELHHCSGLRGNLRKGRRMPATKSWSAQMASGGRKAPAPW